LTNDLCHVLVENFLETSWPCVKSLVENLQNLKKEKSLRTFSLFRFKNDRRVDLTVDRDQFFLRASIEYSNPQLTVEEIQGIVGARLLETCGNFFYDYGLNKPDSSDFAQISEKLKKPSEGPVVSFLLNTDEIEADRYSINPLRQSLVVSGQSAFPAAYVKTGSLEIDQQFVSKYEGTLISRSEAELVEKYLKASGGSYLDLIDSIKYDQLERFSESFGIDLSIPALRMPIETLQSETRTGLLHHLISEIHRDYDAISTAYACMGRSMAKRTTLLTVPHSKKGYGSKRAARGRLHFDGSKLLSANVKYKTTPLYPNEIDPNDVSIAQAEDEFSVSGERLADYSFEETPSSPQFFIYSVGSPEDAVVWHGIGTYAAPKLLESYVSFHRKCEEEQIVKNLTAMYSIKPAVPLQFNLTPESMWSHPKHHNIDASIGTIEQLSTLAHQAMKIELLPTFKWG
jgi:hypothetical protein